MTRTTSVRDASVPPLRWLIVSLCLASRAIRLFPAPMDVDGRVSPLSHNATIASPKRKKMVD
ncbi:hypothetical protein HDF16_005170 [Granulicella aggregans]|uniref:Uncharacterized protein n=1 Tax=Granulicella aggregans TaxID=474949 RepID=A0A7W7ZJ00_9BACT|nr:hypothetical protein [Granulicella aggregans]